MNDPQPAFGRFTAPPFERSPRDLDDWLSEAEEELQQAFRQTHPRHQRLAHLERAVGCIERAKELL
jgi:hypothetical protein